MNSLALANLLRQVVEPVDNLIDCILALAGSKLMSSKVLKSNLSDHLPVLSVFELPGPKSP